VILFGDATGRCAMVAVDSDTTGSNGAARRADGSEILAYHLVAGSEWTFSFTGVPEGAYYLWGYVDVDGSASNPTGGCEITDRPGSGDYFGYFGTGLGPPAAANVHVPHAGGISFVFPLSTVP
jgi:hypothetical protein